MSSPPFKVKAVYEYTSPHEDDLHFPNGQIITVTEEEDDDWYSGEYVDANGVKQEGIFPKNFVEKYEPTAPPRPTRTNRPKKEAEHAPEPAAEPAYIPEPVHEPEPEPEPEEIYEAPAARAPPPSIPEPQKVTSPPPPKSAEVSVPPVAKPAPSAPKPAPPPVSEKPSGNSFKDRIAAFNKAAPPPAPFKPGGLGSGFGGGANYSIKKSFVAPPPSKNAYIPPPTREMAPQKIYRREEDPEIAASQAETQEQAEKAGLVPGGNEGEEEDQPKPTSLKDRIALLQKQQMEQAARHAEAAQKKEKPKKPVKKRTESHGHAEGEEEGAVLERKETSESKPSIDSVREVPRKRKSSRGAADAPPRKSFGDGNEADMSGAGETTEDPQDIDDSDEKPRTRAPPQIPMRAPNAPSHEPEVGEEEGATEEEAPQGENEEEEDEEDEEEDVDPEVRRREELRARMAKMSGGMGMHGMFGAMPMPSPMAPPKKKKSTTDKRLEQEEVSSPTSRAPPVPMPGIVLPGLSRVRSPEETDRQLGHEDAPAPVLSKPADDESDVEEEAPQERSAPPSVPSNDSAAPPIPGGRPAPPPVPLASRPTPPMSPSAGYESDNEQPLARAQTMNLASPTGEAPRPPPRTSTDGLGSPKSPNARRASYFGVTEQQISPTSPTTPSTNKRNSRLPPPIPGAAPPVQNRAPPPPPPTAPAPISRPTTGDNGNLQSPRHPAPDPSDEEVTEYEGDYDTDIASAVPHKDALKAHNRDSSLDDNTPVRTPASLPPPLPSAAAPRAVPPPLPSQPPPNARQSADMPRAAPPPPPPGKMPAPWEQDDDDYDPYKYTASAAPKLPIIPAVTGGLNFNDTERPEEDIYGTSPPRTYTSPSQDRPIPPPPPREEAPPPSTRAPPRQSVEVSRSATTARRSVELSRMSMDSGYVANDVDLAPRSFWWTQPRGVPPVFQGRRDMLLEFEESSQVKRGKSVVVKELYVLFQDYSQTIITATFAAEDPANIKLEQRHEQPPARSRQDQLEQAHEQFGRRISDAIHSRKETIVGDGTPQGLINELLKPLTSALLPVGTRAYGAIIYSNLANASTQQNDEIRPGDIITLRNTRFQGKHGPMHAKYSMEVGKPDHVGIVAEWDGTKKKVRAWEQGRESKKVKMESFKLDDLRSGEVKIWRVMPRSWVGWQGQN